MKLYHDRHFNDDEITETMQHAPNHRMTNEKKCGYH